MQIVFYSVVLNQHQAPVADEFWKLTGGRYAFVELSNIGDSKGGVADYSSRPYLLRAWESAEARDRAMELARTADVCVFAGVGSLPYQRARLKLGLFSFEMGERWLKQGWRNLLSPNLLRNLWFHFAEGWAGKPIYKLCCSAFCAGDQYKLHTFRGKCYKWGYFPEVAQADVEASEEDASTSNIAPLMWCSRYLTLKHPELPVRLAARLKERGYRFVLDMYGSGECEAETRRLAERLGVTDVVRFHGAVPNDRVRAAMRRARIFLFTSDRYEGWGAVANESMAAGCVLVASDAIGSTPYLVQDGVTGCTFESENLDSLCAKVEWLLDDPVRIQTIGRNAATLMQEVWSPAHAARSLLRLIEDLRAGRETSIAEGPCSKALPI